MARRALTSAAALALALALVAAPAWAATGYEHLWKVQGGATGETGQSGRTVRADSVSLSLGTGGYGGTLHYSDLLGVTSGGTFSQESVITLKLTGAPQEGGASVTGTFDGTATLTVRDAASVSEAVASGILSRPVRSNVVYRVTGRWGASVRGDTAEGQVLYETAEVLSAQPADATARDASWFNRLSVEYPDGLGDPQSFVAVVSGAQVPGSGGTGGGTGGTGGGSGSTGNGSSGGSGATSGGRRSTSGSFWRYVAKGLSGGRFAPATPVPNELAQAATRLRDAVPTGATALPRNAATIDIDLAGAYLDAKNRAAGLLSADGPVDGGALAKAFKDAYSAVPGVPAGEGGPEVIALSQADRIAKALEASDAGGEDELLAQVRDVATTGSVQTAAVPKLRAWAAVADAVASPKSYGTVLASTAGKTKAVITTAVPRKGALADAVLAAADSASAPRDALVVAAFQRSTALDADASVSGSGLPSKVLGSSGIKGAGGTLGVGWQAASGAKQAAPAKWLGYTRADSIAFWLAGEGGDVALTDGSLRGWGYSLSRAYLVDATRAGRLLALFPTP